MFDFLTQFHAHVQREKQSAKVAKVHHMLREISPNLAKDVVEKELEARRKSHGKSNTQSQSPSVVERMGNLLHKMIKHEPKPMPIDQNRIFVSAHTRSSLQPGLNLYVTGPKDTLLCATKLFIQRGILPSASRFFICSSSTTFEELEIFVKRALPNSFDDEDVDEEEEEEEVEDAKSHSPLFCICNVHELAGEIQREFLELLSRHHATDDNDEKKRLETEEKGGRERERERERERVTLLKESNMPTAFAKSASRFRFKSKGTRSCKTRSNRSTCITSKTFFTADSSKSFWAGGLHANSL
jgi:hypothetical protein